MGAVVVDQTVVGGADVDYAGTVYVARLAGVGPNWAVLGGQLPADAGGNVVPQ